MEDPFDLLDQGRITPLEAARRVSSLFYEEHKAFLEQKAMYERIKKRFGDIVSKLPGRRYESEFGVSSWGGGFLPTDVANVALVKEAIRLLEEDESPAKVLEVLRSAITQNKGRRDSFQFREAE